MKNWKQKEFGQFVNLRKDKYQPTPGQSIPCVELECITKNSGEITHTISSVTLSSIKNHFSKGDVLFGKLRPYLRKYALPQCDGVCSTEIWVLHPKEGFCSPEFLFLLIQSNKFIYTANLSCGSRMPRADWNLVSSTPFLLPELPEQQKIVEVLETWDKAIQLTRKLIEQKELQKKYLMQQLLTGRTRLKGFTEKWKTIKLGDICRIYQPKTLSTSQLAPTGFPVFGANGPIGFYKEYNHQTWQILITCRGATCGTVNRTFGPAWITGNAMVINADGSSEIEKLFLFYLLMNKNFAPLISGSGQPQIVRGPLENLAIIIPVQKAEQIMISSILQKADKEIDLLRQKLAKLEEQKKGLMQVLLTGKVRLAVKETK